MKPIIRKRSSSYKKNPKSDTQRSHFFKFNQELHPTVHHLLTRPLEYQLSTSPQKPCSDMKTHFIEEKLSTLIARDQEVRRFFLLLQTDTPKMPQIPEKMLKKYQESEISNFLKKLFFKDVKAI